MKKNRFLVMALTCVALCGCGGKEKSIDNAELFKSAKNDAEKVAIVMKSATPDSVARFICNTALGLNKGVSIDTLQSAVLYAYEHYADENLMKFSDEFDNYSSSLPLAQKMKIMSLAALTDPDGLGYKLGIEYAIQIRDNAMTLKEIDRDMAELKKACGDDMEMYNRVLNGLSIALSMPEFADLPKEVIEKYTHAPAIKVKRATVVAPVEEEPVAMSEEVAADSIQ